MQKAEVIFTGSGEGVFLTDGPASGPRRGGAMQQVQVVPEPAMAVVGGKVVGCGPRSEILAAWEAPEIIDLGAGVLVPGFVDPHTHPVFFQTREKEFHMRMAGASYVEISKAGGGILSSIRGVRQASHEDLARLVRERFDRILLEGTTTAEVKSGYGLTTAAEIKSLEVLAQVAGEHPLETVSTFLGAHEFPPEYRDDRPGYMDLLCNEMLPRAQELATFADIFTEGHVFDLEQSRRYLQRARELGYRLRVHADEIEALGGAEMGVELGVDSVDHLVMISAAGIKALAGSETVAVMLPTTTFQLDKPRYAPARELLEAGAVVALATDFNPGTSHVWSMPLVIGVACVKMKLTPAEALQAATINAAFSLGMDDRIGTLHPGKQADFVVLDLPSFQALGYAFSAGIARWVVKQGKVVARPRGLVG